jgi:hypothetical protein
MKMSWPLLVLVMLVSSMAFQSCSKYEEGPAFSLRSKKSRLVNTWKIDKIYNNGTEQTFTTEEQAMINAMTFEFKDDNTYVEHVEVTENEGGITYTIVSETTYDWDFNSNKTKILYSNGKTKTTFSYNGTSQTNEGAAEESSKESEILKLKNDELKLKFTNNQDVLTIEFVSAE